MRVKSEDMFKIRELADLCETFRDYVEGDRQIFIMLNMSRRGVVYTIEFNKDMSWGAPFTELEVPLSFVPLHLFEEYNFDVYYYIAEEAPDDE